LLALPFSFDPVKMRIVLIIAFCIHLAYALPVQHPPPPLDRLLDEEESVRSDVAEVHVFDFLDIGQRRQFQEEQEDLPQLVHIWREGRGRRGLKFKDLNDVVRFVFMLLLMKNWE
jgi:hypothetical protein